MFNETPELYYTLILNHLNFKEVKEFVTDNLKYSHFIFLSDQDNLDRFLYQSMKIYSVDSNLLDEWYESPQAIVSKLQVGSEILFQCPQLSKVIDLS